jgi:hypothetical protein
MLHPIAGRCYNKQLMISVGVFNTVKGVNCYALHIWWMLQ